MGFGSRFNDAKVDAKIGKHLHDLRGTFITRCCLAGLTDQEIADIVGWDTKDTASIRALRPPGARRRRDRRAAGEGSEVMIALDEARHSVASETEKSPLAVNRV